MVSADSWRATAGVLTSPAIPRITGASEMRRGRRSLRSRDPPRGPTSARRVRHQATAAAPAVVTVTARTALTGERSRSEW